MSANNGNNNNNNPDFDETETFWNALSVAIMAVFIIAVVVHFQ